MSGLVVVDESKQDDYVLVAAFLKGCEVERARKVVCELRMPGQRRLHMVKESNPRRRFVLSQVRALGLEVRVYCAQKGTFGTQAQARERCLRALIEDLARDGHTRLILERDATIVGADRKVIRAALLEARYVEMLQYDHDVASMEPLLSIPDAIAWGHTRGGDWRRRSDEIITKLIDV